jgi:hypothetical protein
VSRVVDLEDNLSRVAVREACVISSSCANLALASLQL